MMGWFTKIVLSLVSLAVLSVMGYFCYKTFIDPPIGIGRTVKVQIDTQRIYDGDSFWVKGRDVKFRLFGIDAPETKQVCTSDHETWNCGVESAEYLARMFGDRSLRCDVIAKDFYPNRWDVICSDRGRSVNKMMVSDGWAVAAPKYSPLYVDDEKLARREQLGIWKFNGKMQDPYDFRKDIRNGVNKAKNAGKTAIDKSSDLYENLKERVYKEVIVPKSQ